MTLLSVWVWGRLIRTSLGGKGGFGALCMTAHFGQAEGIRVAWRRVLQAGSQAHPERSFRLGFGGAQPVFGYEADLTVLGKVIGVGFPVGAA